MHPILAYCEKHGLTQREFAKQVALSEPFVSQLIRGRERCGRNAGLKIVSRTGGEVSLERLLTWGSYGARAAS